MVGKRPWKVAAGAAAIVLLAAGCSGGSDESEASGDGIIIGVAEPQHLIPQNTTESPGSQVLSSLFYPLVKFNDQKEPVEAAAESITSDDNKVWTIKLKPGFTFHNGKPVTSDSYINAWNAGAYGPNANNAAFFFERIAGYADLQSKDPDEDGPQKAPEPKAKTMSGLKKVDDTTFTITLSAPFAGWKSVIGYTAFYPLPDEAFSGPNTYNEAFEQAPIGNGPFKMRGKWEHDQQIVVDKVEGFKGDPVKVGSVTWKIFQDPAAQYADLVAGNVDVMTKIPVQSLGTAEKDLPGRFLKSPSSNFAFVGFPVYQKEFANPDVRRALSMAVNRKEMTDQVFLGSETPATSFVSPVVPGYRADTCKKYCTYDPAAAKALYAKAKGPAEIKITYNVDGGHKAWVDAMCNQIKASVGANCVGQGEPKFADLLTKVKAKEPVGLIRLSWIMDYPLMENYLGPVFATGGSSNYYGYSNPAFDSLVKQGSAAKTPEAAIQKWQQAEDILAEDIPVIPLRFGQNPYGFSEKVKNVQVDLFSKTDLYKIELAK